MQLRAIWMYFSSKKKNKEKTKFESKVKFSTSITEKKEIKTELLSLWTMSCTRFLTTWKGSLWLFTTKNINKHQIAINQQVFFKQKEKKVLHVVSSCLTARTWLHSKKNLSKSWWESVWKNNVFSLSSS